jgi:phosphate transport system substrate-binding protein
MGYNEPGKVKMLKVSPKTGAPAIEPSVANTLSKTYPIARELFVYTLGEPQGEVKKYVDWMLGDAGQLVVEKSGYVPLPTALRKK